MPTNVSPDYKKAEEAYRAAREPGDRLDCLKEMLRTIPKHKGTEHLQADIKTRIKHLTEELSGPKKGKRTGPSYAVRREGAAQIALLGPPNSGKSALHAYLTGARAESGPYPFTTKLPLPGMLVWNDVHFQLVDLPPISDEYMDSWFPNALQSADAALLVVDLADPEVTDQAQAVIRRLYEKRITLGSRWPGFDNEVEAPDADDPFRIVLPTLLVANKADLDPNPGNIEVFEDLLKVRYPAVAASALGSVGCDTIGSKLFAGLEIVRVYTKTPGHAAETDKPFTVRKGDAIADVARLVHKDFADHLDHARVWGSGQFDGQRVGPDHIVEDGDIVELHMKGAH